MIYSDSGRLDTALKKEMLYIRNKEENFLNNANKQEAAWKADVAAKIPDKVYKTLNTAFEKAFFIIFDKGIGIIEKTYDRKELEYNHKIHDYAIQLKGSRKELKKLRGVVEKSGFITSAITTAEGVGLGILGIGLPDIVVFIGLILRGIYEISLNYGYDYNNPKERMIILKILEASCSKGKRCFLLDSQIESLMKTETVPDEQSLKEQVKNTAEALALDMLVLKFVQGLPVVGMLGGLGNPVYYNKIINYAGIKYYKRYLEKLCVLKLK